MPIELVEALILIAKFCVSYENCAICPLKNFCGKMPSEWQSEPAPVRVEFPRSWAFEIFQDRFSDKWVAVISP